MLFMNEWEIDRSVDAHRGDPVLGPATQFLRDFKDEVNRHSDGWPYWSPPVHAAAQLMTLIQDAGRSWQNKPRPTMADVQKALRPIKAFMTRRGYKAGMKLPTLQLVLPLKGEK